MNSRTLTTIIVLLALLLAVFFFLPESAPPGEGNENTQSENLEVASDQNTWSSYENESFPFTFDYPVEATVGVEDEGVEVQLFEPGNIPNSEVLDGFTFYLKTEMTAVDAREYAEAMLEAEPEYAPIVEPLTTGTVGDKEAFTYSARSAIGIPITNIIFPANDGRLFIVSYIVTAESESREKVYEDVIFTILGTLNLR